MYISYEFIFGYCKLWPTGISVFFRFLIHLIALKVHNWRNVIFNIVPKEIFVVVENFYQMDINKFQTGFRFCLCLWLNECYMIVSSILERLKRWTFRNISTVSILNDHAMIRASLCLWNLSILWIYICDEWASSLN